MAFNISYVFQAQDKFSAVARKVKNSMSGVQEKAKKVSKSIKGIGSSFISAAGKAKFFSAASLGMAANAVRLWGKQEEAIAQVRTAIQSTGGAAGFTLDQLTKQASKLQGSSLFGDEDILQGVTAQLLTFTNIAGNQFSNTQQAAIDLATRLKIDLKSATIQLGKALNDPISNLSALSRSGIQFSETQEEMIKGLAGAGRMAEAQSIILKELKTQYGGSALAAAEAGTGGFIQMSNALGDAQEVIGEVIGKALLPMAKSIKKLAVEFQGASPFVKKMAAGLFVLVAVVAPLLAVIGALMIGLSALAPIFAAISAGFALMTLPILGVIAAVVALVAAGLWLKYNWLDVSNAIGGTIEQIGINFDLMVSGIKEKLSNLGDFLRDAPIIGSLINLTADAMTAASEFTGNLDVNIADKGGNVDSVSGSASGGVSMNTGVNM